mmetsp:Transcript_126751/g.247021  ORF Transcript_126751/g.247021 Transcript_126751/m.247021 type:complete len:279 (-) Transcript_126751:26-862(-)
MADIEDCARSRSPHRSSGEGSTEVTAAPAAAVNSATAEPAPDASKTPEVPAHWLAPPTGAPAEPAEKKPWSGKGKNGKGKRGATGAGEAKTDVGKDSGPVTATALLAMAVALDNRDEEAAPEPAQISRLLRQAAVRLGSLEKTVAELGQTMQAVHVLTGRSLNGLGVSDKVDGSTSLMEEECATKSYLHKRGDDELQEQHRSAAQVRPVQVSGGSTGGSDTSAKTKEEMDQARKARLERLEAQQAERRKQIEDADKRSKARDAMFASGVGPAKQLGQL